MPREEDGLREGEHNSDLASCCRQGRVRACVERIRRDATGVPAPPASYPHFPLCLIWFRAAVLAGPGFPVGTECLPVLVGDALIPGFFRTSRRLILRGPRFVREK